ncbi:hypothetical protein K440DRAFT_643323 [Wilcoxina mikolae CBS 423.85]|nr:hypothetical protein K440DRAFT_643323 [Wilcoxina mikolae CBS 423.85]
MFLSAAVLSSWYFYWILIGLALAAAWIIGSCMNCRERRQRRDASNVAEAANELRVSFFRRLSNWWERRRHGEVPVNVEHGLGQQDSTSTRFTNSWNRRQRPQSPITGPVDPVPSYAQALEDPPFERLLNRFRRYFETSNSIPRPTEARGDPPAYEEDIRPPSYSLYDPDIIASTEISRTRSFHGRERRAIITMENLSVSSQSAEFVHNSDDIEDPEIRWLRELASYMDYQEQERSRTLPQAQRNQGYPSPFIENWF